MNHPLLLLALLAGAVYLAKLWQDDRRAWRAGEPNLGALPGATDAPVRASWLGALGAIVLVAFETLGERALGIDDQQSRITLLFAFYSIFGAAVIEELIFRGWVVIERRGRPALWTGVVGASLIFALIHPFLWEWQQGTFVFHLTPKAIFSTALAFATSLWLYVVRFGPWNPQRSLLPCFIAHGAKNAAVVAVKAASGFVTGPW